MNDIVTAATKVAKRLSDSDEDPSPSEIASAVDEAADDNQNNSAIKQYAKKAALIAAVSLVQRYLENREEGIAEDATRVEVVDTDERVTESDASKSKSEESSGGLLSLKRVLFLGALVGVGYAAVKKLRSRGDQHTLEEWDEPAASESTTVGGSDTDESEDVSDHAVDIGAGEADENEGESGATTDPTEVGDGEPVEDVEDEPVEVEDDDSVAAAPGEVAVEEDVVEEVENDDNEDEDEDDERLSQSE